MNIQNTEAAIEAVLFTMGQSVPLEKLSAAVGQDKETTRKIISNLCTKYDDENRGIQIIELDGSYQMTTKPEYYDVLIAVASQPRKYVLTDVLLETLSIVAYKQPITRAEIEKIRGVSCEHAINKLIEYSLIEEVGRMDAPGRPILFGTTEEFLRAFGVTSLKELPAISDEMIAKFKEEAELEISKDDDEIEGQMTLDI